MSEVHPLFTRMLTWTTLLGLSAVGCQERAVTGTNGAAIEERTSLSPEESFEQIADSFSRAIETGTGGISSGITLSREEGGHSRLVVNNEVAHQFIPPSADADTCRGIITVTSQTDYSLQRIADDNESNDGHEVDAADHSDGEESLSLGVEGVEILDADLVAEETDAPRKPDKAAEDLIARRSNRIVSKYELEYVNNRWELKTELDPDTERAIKNAFKHILDAQP